MFSQKRIKKELDPKNKFLGKHNEFSLLPYYFSPTIFTDDAIINECDTIINDVVLINKNTKVIELTISISDNYPFRVPRVTLSNYMISKTKLSNKSFISAEFHNWSYNLLKHFDKTSLNNNDIYVGWLLAKNYYNSIAHKWAHVPNSTQCLGCESVICTNNWSPSLTIYNIAYEYLLRKRFMIYTSDNNLKYFWRIINPIFSKYSNQDINIPDDIILHILSFGIPNIGF